MKYKVETCLIFAFMLLHKLLLDFIYLLVLVLLWKKEINSRKICFKKKKRKSFSLSLGPASPSAQPLLPLSRSASWAARPSSPAAAAPAARPAPAPCRCHVGPASGTHRLLPPPAETDRGATDAPVSVRGAPNPSRMRPKDHRAFK